MKTISVIYNKDTSFIVDIANEFEKVSYLEFLNIDYTKDKRKARKLQEDFGSQNLPLLVFEDENLEYCGAIWSEENPNWKDKIIKLLKK